MLELRPCKPAAFGRHRWVFDDPDDRKQLIKIVGPEAKSERFAARPWYKRTARAREYRVFVRELNEFIAMRAP